MKYCKHLKKRKNKPYCSLLKKEILFSDCNKCNSKEYKKIEIHSKKRPLQEIKSHKMVNKSEKQSKLERDRFSVFTYNKYKCMFCESTYKLTWHEIFQGKNRTNSMKYGFCLRMCLSCHELYQEDNKFNRYWHIKAEEYFTCHIGTKDEFIRIFRRNYLK